MEQSMNYKLKLRTHTHKKTNAKFSLSLVHSLTSQSLCWIDFFSDSILVKIVPHSHLLRFSVCKIRYGKGVCLLVCECVCLMVSNRKIVLHTNDVNVRAKWERESAICSQSDDTICVYVVQCTVDVCCASIERHHIYDTQHSLWTNHTQCGKPCVKLKHNTNQQMCGPSEWMRLMTFVMIDAVLVYFSRK